MIVSEMRIEIRVKIIKHFIKVASELCMFVHGYVVGVSLTGTVTRHTVFLLIPSSSNLSILPSLLHLLSFPSLHSSSSSHLTHSPPPPPTSLILLLSALPTPFYFSLPSCLPSSSPSSISLLSRASSLSVCVCLLYRVVQGDE